MSILKSGQITTFYEITNNGMMKIHLWRDVLDEIFSFISEDCLDS